MLSSYKLSVFYFRKILRELNYTSEKIYFSRVASYCSFLPYLPQNNPGLIMFAYQSVPIRWLYPTHKPDSWKAEIMSYGSKNSYAMH